MPRKLDDRKINRILQVLSFNFAEPKRHSFIWNCVKELREGNTKHIATKKTLNLYLDRMVKDGKIVKIRKSWKHVTYALTEEPRRKWGIIKKDYDKEMRKRIQKFETSARDTMQAVNSGDIPREKIEGVVSNAWLFCVANSTDALNLLVDAGQSVSFVAHACLDDWVMSPFMLSAKVVEACHRKHPKETKRTLERLRNMFQKAPLG